MDLPVLTPSDFVTLLNQTLGIAFPVVEIEGEVLNYKVSKNRWVYFDIADEDAKLRCFGTVYMLPAPVEDGMKVRIVAVPRLHPQFNFSLNLQSLRFSGEGSIKKASNLLQQKLEQEGLFAAERKRPVPYPPATIGLITSGESAAYHDFVKVLSGRWGGLNIELADVQVQGEAAVNQTVRAVEWFNRQAVVPDVLVLIRGGGSADDLQAFSAEQVVRAVAASRIPTAVAIGHEVDTSLAELAADMRASTPSNVAELLVPDRKELLRSLSLTTQELHAAAALSIGQVKDHIKELALSLHEESVGTIHRSRDNLATLRRTLDALSPKTILKRGYSITRLDGVVVRSTKRVKASSQLTIELSDGIIKTRSE